MELWGDNICNPGILLDELVASLARVCMTLNTRKTKVLTTSSQPPQQWCVHNGVKLEVQVSNRLQYRPKDAMHPTLGFIAIMCAFPVRARESQSMCPESGTIWCLPECVSFGPLHQIGYWQDNIFKNLRTLTSLKQSTSVKPQAATNPHLTKCHLACKQPSPLCLEKRSKHFRVRAG